MSNNCYGTRPACTVLAIAASLVLGIVTAFLRITGVLTIGTAFLWVAFGIGVAALPVLLAVAAYLSRRDIPSCVCRTLSKLTLSILATILFAVILLAFEFVTTSIIGAIITGLLILSLSLIFTLTACLINCLSDCDDD